MAEVVTQGQALAIDERIERCLSASNLLAGVQDPGAFSDAVAAWQFLGVTGLNENGLLGAHKRLMTSQPSRVILPAEMGRYRMKAAAQDGRLMPPTYFIPRMVNEVLTRAQGMNSQKVGDVLTRIRPFAAGNARMARLVVHHLQVERGEIPVPVEGRHAAEEALRHKQWFIEHYPECNEKCQPKNEKAESWPWQRIILREIIL